MKLCYMFVNVFKCFALFLKNLIFKRKKSLSTDYGEPDWKSDIWEDFSVSVIPNSAPTPKSDDIFSDMQPVIKKTKKVSSETCASWFAS